MLRKITIYIVLFVLIASAGAFVLVPNAQTDASKEYRNGEITQINNADYLIVSNSKFVEILEVTKENKLVQASEVHGMERINDLGVIWHLNKPYLIVLTGQYLIKYDISNPNQPVVDLKRDLYDFKRGKYKIGYMHSMALNDTHIFTAGSRGIRRFMVDNLFVDKIYYFENARGLDVNNEILAFVTPVSGLVYDVEGGNMLRDVELANAYDQERQPAIDDNGNVYFPGDNTLNKVSVSGFLEESYENPVTEGVVHSYAADIVDNKIVYINGYGVTKFDNAFNKNQFIHTAKPSAFGSNSWAVGIEAGNTSNGARVAVLNKSSVILLDGNFKVLDQYRYTPRLIDSVVTPTELEVRLSKITGIKGDRLTVSAFGFWPNENVSIGFYEFRERSVVKTDNLGFVRTELTVPDLKPGRQVISAIGNDSGLSYQITFELR